MGSGNKRTLVRPGRSNPLRVEQLESRTMLAASIFQVTNLDDSGDGSLRQAIIDANANPGTDTIRFARRLQGEIQLTSQLLITDDLNIKGPGADKVTVSGNKVTRVMGIIPADLESDPNQTPSLSQLASAPTVKIDRLGIHDGYATDALGFDPDDAANPGFAFGAGIYLLGGTLHLDRMDFRDNVITGFISAGGSVAVEFGGTLHVTRSHFEDNESQGALIAVAGGITSDMGPTTDGVNSDPSFVSVSTSQFVDNVAQTQLGHIDGVAFSGFASSGAILNVTGTTEVSRSHFEGNQAIAGTGAEGNVSGGLALGGAIGTSDVSALGLAESTLKITSSTFENNVALGGGSAAEGVPGGIGLGGAVAVVNGSDAVLRGNRFINNHAQGGDGGDDANGGIGSGGAVGVAGSANLTSSSNTFSENEANGGSGSGTGKNATGRGGAMSLDSNELTGIFPGSGSGSSTADRFARNAAYGGIGGGIYNEGELNVRHGNFQSNKAIGEADARMTFVPLYVFEGSALGGAISNVGELNVSGSTFQHNEAIGADNAVGPNVLLLPPDTAVSTYPGIAVGGAIHNLTEAIVDRSRFISNVAQGGDNNNGSFSGVGNGGALYNDGELYVKRSMLRNNMSKGGDNNTGDVNAGGGYGGGITSGTITALAEGGRSSKLAVHRSHLIGNEASGGDGNVGLIPVPDAHATSNGIGGAIVAYQGSADISRSHILNNTAKAGNDGVAVGGGIHFLSFIGSIEGSVSRSIVARNRAIGSSSGDATGGGIATGSMGSFLGSGGSVDINRSLIFGNMANGGDEGDGLGGGIYNGEGVELNLERTPVFRNSAKGGVGGNGIGGGVYNLGELELVLSHIFANWASTSDDDCFGC